MVKRLLFGFELFRTFVFISGVCILMQLIACNADELIKKGNSQRGQGVISLDLKTDTAYAKTKASSNPENLNDYKLSIFRGEEEVSSFRFGDKPELLTLDAGSYTAKATWGTLVPAAFDSLYMEGGVSFVVKDGETTSVKLDCRPANAKVTVDYDDAIRRVYQNYKVSMSTNHTGNSPLVFQKDETRAGFFQINPGGEKLRLDMVFSTASKDYPLTQSMDLLPRDFVRLHFKLGNTPSDKDSITDPTLSVNVAGLLFEADKNLKREISVSSNSEWIFVNTVDWLILEKQSGKILFTVKPNTTNETRQTTVTVIASNGNKFLSSNIAVFQQGKSPTSESDLLVDIVDLIMSSDAFQQSVNVKSTVPWTYSNDAETWLHVSRTEGNNAILTLSAEANNTAESRKGIITLKTGSQEAEATTITINVEQKAKEEDPYIKVDFSTLKLSAEGATNQFYAVETNQSEWTVSSSAEWMDVLKDGDNMVLSIEPNTENQVRSAELTLTASQGVRTMTVKITVIQDAKPLDVPPLQVEITINRNFIKEETVTYTIDNLYSTDRTFDFKYSEGYGTFTCKKGSAPLNCYLNITGRNGAKIKQCIWKDVTANSGTVDLADISDPGAEVLRNSGLMWDRILKEQTLATIYLDRFIKNLEKGLHEYQLTVSGQGDDGLSYSKVISLKVEITE